MAAIRALADAALGRADHLELDAAQPRGPAGEIALGALGHQLALVHDESRSQVCEISERMGWTRGIVCAP